MLKATYTWDNATASRKITRTKRYNASKNHSRLNGLRQTQGSLQIQPCHLPEKTVVQLKWHGHVKRKSDGVKSCTKLVVGVTVRVGRQKTGRTLCQLTCVCIYNYIDTRYMLCVCVVARVRVCARVYAYILHTYTT